MNLLLYCEVCKNLPLPVLDEALQKHIAEKRHPDVRAASLTAWNLLAAGLKQLGLQDLPSIAFTKRGKPFFPDCSLHFSLSHSGRLASVLISDAPCAVDIEALRPEIRQRLEDNCLSEDEKQAGCEFFETWTRKECIGKLEGTGIPAHPAGMNSLDARYDACFFSHTIADSNKQQYMLTALCTDRIAPVIQKIEPETLF